MEVGFARRANDLLIAGGMDVEYHESDAAHHIDPAHVPAAIDWVGRDAGRDRRPKIGRTSRCATTRLDLASWHDNDPF